MRTEAEYAYNRVAKALIADIAAGYFPQGKRLPGCRRIGEKYNVCMITARQAMEKLENDGILQRKGSRGTFIRPEFIRNGGRRKQISVVYPVSPDYLLTHSFESWNIHVEIMRGLMQEAALRNVAPVTYELLEENSSPKVQEALHSRLSLRDGVIFIGSCYQTLAERLKAGGIPSPCILPGSISEDSRFIGCAASETYGMVASYIAYAGYSHVDIVDGSFAPPVSPHSKAKIAVLRNALAGKDISADIFSAESREELPLLLKQNPNRLIYVMNTSALPVIYGYAFEYGLVPGRDFELLAFATGHTFSNFYPRVSFFRPRFSNFGRAAVLQLLGEKSDDLRMTPEFFQGDTTRNITNPHAGF